MNQSPYPASAKTVAARRVDVAGADAGADRGEAGELGLEHEVVDPSLLVGRLADDERAGHVGVVAVDERADVDDHGVALDDRAPAGLVVRAGGVVRTAGDDRVVARAVGAEAAHAVLELVAHVGLGRACRRASARRRRAPSSAIAAARAMRASSPSSLTRRSLGDGAVVRSQVEVAGQVGPRGVGEVRRPRRATGPAPAHVDDAARGSFGRVVAATTSASTPGGGEVGGGPLGVAAVGDEDDAVGTHDDPAERAAERRSASGCSTASRRAAWRRRGAARAASGRVA